MPYIINTIVLDEAGYPLQQVAVIKEVSENAGQLTVANGKSDETGKISFVPLSMGSTVEISSVGYKPKTFPAFEVPAVVLLEPAIVIEGKTTATAPKKEDNTMLYIAVGSIAIAAAIAIVLSKKAAKTNSASTTKTKQPGLKIPVINI